MKNKEGQVFEITDLDYFYDSHPGEYLRPATYAEYSTDVNKQRSGEVAQTIHYEQEINKCIDEMYLPSGISEDMKRLIRNDIHYRIRKVMNNVTAM